MLKKFDWENFSLDDFKAKLANYRACPEGWYEAENTLCPPKIIVTKTEILHLVFWVHVDITSWIIFVHFKCIALTLKLN
jgi:hypothetical protein